VEGGDGGSQSPLHVEGDPVIQPHMAGGEQVHIAGSKQPEVEGQHHAYPFAGEGFGLNLLVEIYFSFSLGIRLQAGNLKKEKKNKEYFTLEV
jgi:hypothetical protein